MTTDIHNSFQRLSLRKQQIVAHVVRDRLTTNEVVQQRFFDRGHPTSVTRTTAHLCETGWLTSFPLVYPTRYFRLGKRAVRAFGTTLHATRPLGPQALPTEYAVLRYTATNHEAVRRLTLAELQALHPWYQPEWLSAPHCLRLQEGEPQTELIRVDLGGPVDHLTRKCLAEIAVRYGTEAFRELLEQRQFQLVIVTGTTQKAAQIDTALSMRDWPTGVRFRIAVFTDLLTLLPRGL